MGEAAKRIATYNDLLAVPAHLLAEIVDGELYTQSRPAMLEAATATALSAWSHTRFHSGENGPGGWWIVHEPEVHLGADICVPDIAGWRKSRMPRYPKTAFVSVPPDWICEVLSPSTEAFDRAMKMTVYAREGVNYAWLVNPLERLLEAYELGNKLWVRIAVHVHSECVRVRPFEEVELNLASLWAGLDE